MEKLGGLDVECDVNHSEYICCTMNHSLRVPNGIIFYLGLIPVLFSSLMASTVLNLNETG